MFQDDVVSREWPCVCVLSRSQRVPDHRVCFREEDRISIEKLADSSGVELHLMSNETEEGVAEVKTAACDKLLQARVDARMAGKKVPACICICCV